MGSRRQQQQQQRFDYLLFANAIPEVNYVNNIENKKLHVLSFFCTCSEEDTKFDLGP